MDELISNLTAFEERVACRNWEPYFFSTSMDAETQGYILNTPAFRNITHQLGIEYKRMQQQFPTWQYATDTHDEGDMWMATMHSIIDCLYELTQEVALFTSMLHKRKTPPK